MALTLPVDFVKVLELMPGGNDLLLRAGFGWKADYIGSIVMSKERDDYAGYILDAVVPVITADFATEKRFAVPQYLHNHGCVSGMSTIITGQDGRAYGVLGVCTKTRAGSANRTFRSLLPSPISSPAPFNAGNWSSAMN